MLLRNVCEFLLSQKMVLINYSNLHFVSKVKCVGFYVFTAVVLKSTLFWDITPCSPLKVSSGYAVSIMCVNLAIVIHS
jgi:hypothetical protein